MSMVAQRHRWLTIKVSPSWLVAEVALGVRAALPMVAMVVRPVISPREPFRSKLMGRLALPIVICTVRSFRQTVLVVEAREPQVVLEVTGRALSTETSVALVPVA
jgi:hypothetical protein